MGRKDSIPDDAPAPRLCSLSKWEHFQGYGFNLHSEKGKEGQYIGKIDPASPAEACGLVEGDQIIEVNGVNTSNENHKQVVQRIKADPDKVDLLVVDSAAAEYYKKRGIVVKGSMANVKKMKNGKESSDQDQETGETSSQAQPSVEDCLTYAANCNEDVPPPIPPKTDLSLEVAKDCGTNDDSEDKPDDNAEKEKVSDVSKDAEEPKEAELPPPPPAEKAAETTDSSEEEKQEEEQESTGASTEKAVGSSGSENGKAETSQKSAEKEPESPKAESPRIDTTLQVDSGSDRAQPSPAPSAGSTGTVESAKSAGSAKSAESAKSGGETEDKFGLKLNMTAAEMKEYLKSKKRPDPRNDNLTFKQRHAIVSNM